MPLTIEVAEITPPAYGKKKSKIITRAGETYYVWPDKLGELGLVAGHCYAIECEESTFRGTTFRSIVTATPTTTPMTNGNGHGAPSASPPNEQKFVTTLLAGFISSRQITPTDKALMWETTKNLRGLWAATFGGKTNGSTSH